MNAWNLKTTVKHSQRQLVLPEEVKRDGNGLPITTYEDLMF